VSTKAPGDPAGKPIGVFLLDDHEIVRRGIRGLLEAEPDIQVIGEAGTASAALASIPGLRPDVALLDARLPDGDGVSVCRDVRSRAPGVACLIFTAFSDDQVLLDSILAGAAGYVLKQVRGSDLAGAVRTAASGQSLLNPRAASKLIARRRDASGKHDPQARLTPRERSVLELIGEGLTNRQIGERLFIAEKTVKNYVSTLFRKLGLKQRTAAAAYVTASTTAGCRSNRARPGRRPRARPPGCRALPRGQSKQARDEDRCRILSQSLMLLLWAGHSGSGSSCHPWLVSQARSAVGWFGSCLRS